jgi:hypothetical protein
MLKAASERANVRVLAPWRCRRAGTGLPGSVPYMPARDRLSAQHATCPWRSVRPAGAGWSRLQMACLTVADEEARRLTQEVPE